MSFVRRSERDPNNGYLERGEVKKLLAKVRGNDRDTVVLKLKDHLVSDINSLVLDEIIVSLRKNTVCQALYFQNISRAMKDQQLDKLVQLLKQKNSKIWCLNLGENYEVTSTGWTAFCKALPDTNVTHIYVSEHVISMDLKNKIRSNIRENRKKHTRHCDKKNIDVIERCTNMWWNPINGASRTSLSSDPPCDVLCLIPPHITPQCHPAIRHRDAAAIERERQEEERRKQEAERCMKEALKSGNRHKYFELKNLTEQHAEYWAPNGGRPDAEEWKFDCKCGVTCSSYENVRWHPQGNQVECTRCRVWSHSECLPWLKGYSQDDLLELREEVLCWPCHSKVRRLQKQAQSAAGLVDALPPELLAAVEIGTTTTITTTSSSSSNSNSSSSDSSSGDVGTGDDADNEQRRKAARTHRELPAHMPPVAADAAAAAAGSGTVLAAVVDAAAAAQPASDCSGSTTSSEGKNDAESCERSASPTDLPSKADSGHKPVEPNNVAETKEVACGEAAVDSASSALDEFASSEPF